MGELCAAVEAMEAEEEVKEHGITDAALSCCIADMDDEAKDGGEDGRACAGSARGSSNILHSSQSASSERLSYA